MKFKIACLVISSLLLNASHAMRRAPLVHGRTTCPRRPFFGSSNLGCAPFKVVPPAYLKEKVEKRIEDMDAGEWLEYKSFNASLVTYAFNRNLIFAHRLLKGKDAVERSIVLDQVDASDGRSLLLKATNIGALHFMDFLLHHGANAAITDKYGATSLTINALRLTPALLDKLIANGAWCMEQDQFKRNMLHYLAMRANGKKSYTLPPSGEDYSVYEEINGNVARKVIPEGANMYGLDVNDKTPIDLALETEHIEVLKAFIDCGANAEAIIAKAGPKIVMDLEHYCQKY